MANNRDLIITCTFKAAKIKVVEFANRADSDDVTHYEPHHLNLHCLPSSL